MAKQSTPIALLLRGIGVVTLVAPVLLLALPAERAPSEAVTKSPAEERQSFAAGSECELDEPARLCVERGRWGIAVRWWRRRYA